MFDSRLSRNNAEVIGRFLSLLVSPAPTTRFESLLPPEMHLVARATYFLLDTSQEHYVENFITHVVGRLIQRLNRDTRQTTVTYQGRVRGRVVWPATLKAHYGQDYDPSRYVCREVRREFDTPENRLLKHLLERLSECLNAVPDIVRSGVCYSVGADCPDFTESSAYRLERMEQAVNRYLRHVAMPDISPLPIVTEWHLLQAETARIDEYVEVARFFRRYQKVVIEKRWSTTFDIGKRMLPLPGRLGPDGDRWLQFAFSIFHTNAAKGFRTMDKKFHFNGLNGSTGAPLVPPMEAAELIEWIKAGDEKEDLSVKDSLRTTREQKSKAKLGFIEGVDDPLDLDQTRWGVIYPPGVSQKTKNALKPLVDARKGVELTYNSEGKPAGETAKEFRKHFDQTPGKLDPKKLPYYLLIVASPEQVPFKFQYGLAADHAVGRLYFDDENDYARYVTSLLDHEGQNKQSRRRLLCTFAPANADDDATGLSMLHLAKPLANKLNQKELLIGAGNSVKYDVEEITGAAATKQAFTSLLTRQDKQPAVIFTATHGLGFQSGDLRQLDEQGALVCQDWPGPQQWPEGYPLQENMFFAGKHIPNNVQLNGLVVFSFACYSAGTPRIDDFSYFQSKKPKELSPQAFISKLPQRLLAQGALAFIGHVERAWDYSFVFSGVGEDVSTFQSTLEAILKGKPIGHALQHFSDRYLAFARELTDSEQEGMLHQYNLGEPVDPSELVSLWTAHNDARAYMLFGDPYARLKPALMDPI